MFSASVILWEILAGRRMYKKPPHGEVIDLARAGDVPTLPERGFPSHARLQEILSRGLAKQREDRYATAGAMLRDLEAYVAGAKLMASPMRFGAFLTEQFEGELVSVRRTREQAALSVTVTEPVEVIPDLALPSSAPPPAPQDPPVPAREPALTALEPSAPQAVSLTPSGRPKMSELKPPPAEPPKAKPNALWIGAALALAALIAVAAMMAR